MPTGNFSPLVFTHHSKDIRIEKVDVVTGSRLHFGLLATKCTSAPSFGGCGLMLHRPSVWVHARISKTFSATGHHVKRCTEVAERFRVAMHLDDLPACEIKVARVPDAHTGLGSGTQINLAIACALSTIQNARIQHSALATNIAQRGRRSAVGVHGFALGGFIAESGIPDNKQLGALHTRIEFPKDWRVLLMRPSTSLETVFGETETGCFSSIDKTDDMIRDSLYAMMVDQIIPALRSADYLAFVSAVHTYNHQSGMLFAKMQGGAYNGPRLGRIVDYALSVGCRGVGQSSWGPTIFAICENQDVATELKQKLLEGDSPEPLEIEVTEARNKPASICFGSSNCGKTKFQARDTK